MYDINILCMESAPNGLNTFLSFIQLFSYFRVIQMQTNCFSSFDLLWHSQFARKDIIITRAGYMSYEYCIYRVLNWT